MHGIYFGIVSTESAGPAVGEKEYQYIASLENDYCGE